MPETPNAAKSLMVELMVVCYIALFTYSILKH